MSERKLILHNFKKLKSAEYDFDDVIAITGQNESGKTSVVQAIQSLHLMNGFVKQPLNDQSKDGSVTFIGPDKNGNEITIKWTFDESGDSFVAIVKDEHGVTKPISNVKKILELMGTYYPLTVQEFFAKAKYAEGRKELIEKYFLLCLSETQRAEVEKLQLSVSNKVNSKTKDNLYFQRRDIKSEIDVLNKVVANVTITEEEQKLLDSEPKYRETLEAINNKMVAQEIRRQELEKELGDLNMSITENRERVSKAKNIFTRIDEIKKRVNSDSTNKVQIANKTTLLQKLEAELNIVKEKIKAIYKNSKLPAGLEIEEDSFSLNGFVFDETTNSESEAWMAVIELMCQITDCPLLVIGAWETFDKNKKNKIIELSQKSNKFVIGTQVVDDLVEPKVVTIVKK